MIMKFEKLGVITLAMGVLVASQSIAQAAPKPAQPKSTQQEDTMEKINQSIDQGVKKIKETLRIEPGQNATPEQEAKISSMANDAVKKIEAAQTSIEQNKLTDAKTQLSQAQELLEGIQATKPTAQVIDKVQTTRKQLETSQTATTDLAPLESEIVKFEKITPAPEAKAHLDKAQNSLKDKKKDEATQHLVQVEESLIYAEADLPVSRTKQDVLGAQTLLSQNKPQEAHKLLTDSLKHIQVLATEVDETKTAPASTSKAPMKK